MYAGKKAAGSPTRHQPSDLVQHDSKTRNIWVYNLGPREEGMPRGESSRFEVQSMTQNYHDLLITTLPADAWFAARLLPKVFRFDSLAILEPNYSSRKTLYWINSQTWIEEEDHRNSNTTVAVSYI
ncbi:unnamed protein product [Dovyalis caffra]|uniref:Uncharacterized protein n=1 Tax=Dovyalis caffra TaxID=77055 RepID=A0AAV1QX07_9ROSI|nr:unnamed protein product [Dovyalis caffra]